MPGHSRRTADDAPATISAPHVSAEGTSTTAGAAPADIDVTTDSSIVPENLDDLSKAQLVEAIIASGRQDQESVVAIIESLLEAELHVPMGLDADGALAMGAVMTEVEGVVYVAVFTSMDAAAHVRDMAPEFAVMTGKKIIGTLRADLGLVVETGAGKFGLIPPMLASIRATIQAREEASSLEDLANKVRSGAAQVDELIAALMQSKVVIPTPEEPTDDGGFTPVIEMVGGAPRLVVATSFEAAARFRDVAAFAIPIDGRSLFAILKEGVGIQLNTAVGSVDFPPELCAVVATTSSLAGPAAANT